MGEFLKTLLSLSVSGTLLFLLLKLLKPLYRERFSRRWQYYVWLVALFRFLLPFGPEAALMNQVFTAAETAVQEYAGQGEMPENQTGTAEETETAEAARLSWEAGGEALSGTDTEAGTEAAGTEPPSGQPAGPSGIGSEPLFWHVLFMIWSAGAALHLFFKVRIYRRYAGGLEMEENLASDGRERELLTACAEDMGIRGEIRLYRSGKIASPVLLGICKPALVMPVEDVQEQMLTYVFRHELTHCRRRDILYKWLIQLTVCVHWFNPFVRRLEKEAGQACELACDEAVIASLDAGEKRKYGDMLLKFAKAESSSRTVYGSAALTEGGEHLKERLGAIMKFKKGTKTAAAASIAALAVLIAGAVFLGSYINSAPKGQTGEDAADSAVRTELTDQRTAMDTDGAGNGASDAQPGQVSSGEAYLKLVRMEALCPYYALEFQFIEENGEVRIFSPSASDFPQIELDMEEVYGLGYYTTGTEVESDTVGMSVWSGDWDSVTVTVDGVPCTVELPREEPREVLLNQSVDAAGDGAVLESALVYSNAFVLHVSGVSEEAFQNTLFVLSESSNGTWTTADGFSGWNAYDGDVYTAYFAFPEGFADRKLALRIGALEREAGEEREWTDYPLNLQG